tara:strand:+ start:929 stop:1747 length:819 start_codon:yes stop_codon:yes gene_type:complete
MSEEATQETGSQEVAPEAVTQTAPANFLESLPEDLRDNPSLRNFTDAGSLAKSYVHARSMIGADSIGKPQQSWTPDQYAQFYAETGRPQSASEYAIDFGVEVADGDLEAFRQAAFDAGLAPGQAQTIAQYLSNQAQGAYEYNEQSAAQAVDGAIQELKSEYGQAYEQKTQMAYNAATTLLGKEGLAIFEEVQLEDGRRLGDHPDIVRMFVNLAEKIGEDSLLGEPTELIKTPDQAKQELKELMRPGTPYTDSRHPEHDAYVQKAQELFELAS